MIYQYRDWSLSIFCILFKEPTLHCFFLTLLPEMTVNIFMWISLCYSSRIVLGLGMITHRSAGTMPLLRHIWWSVFSSTHLKFSRRASISQTGQRQIHRSRTEINCAPLMFAWKDLAISNPNGCLEFGFICHPMLKGKKTGLGLQGLISKLREDDQEKYD